MKPAGKIFVWSFLSVVPIILFSAVPLWGPVLLGREGYAAFDGSAAGTGIMVVLILLPFAVVMFSVFKVFWKPMASLFGGTRETKRIRATGRPAKATIRAIGESSLGGTITVNQQPYVNLTLEVDDGFGAPYLASLDTLLPRTAIPQFQPGAVIPVKVDPEDPQKVAIDWGGGQVT